MRPLTGVRRAATRARLFILGRACAWHYRTFSAPFGYDDLGEPSGAIVEQERDIRTCSTMCEAVGGDDDCRCVPAPFTGTPYDPGSELD